MSSLHHNKPPSALTQPAFYPRTSHAMTRYALIMSSIAIAPLMLGCQSSAMRPALNPAPMMIDFNTTDTAQQQAQAQAFSAALAADAQDYQQQFDQSAFPNSENQAKQHLLTAIRKHLATDQVAVARARYKVTPFINADSIDADASGLLRTVLELYAYRSAKQHEDSNDDGDYNDYNDSDSDSDSEYDNENEDTTNDAATIEGTFDATQYDAEGYNKYDYDREGYDRDGYNQYGYDEYGYDVEGYDEQGYDREHYDRENNDHENDDREYQGNETNGVLSRIASLKALNSKSIASNYEAMQAAKQASAAQTATAPSTMTGVLGQLLGTIHRTPEQVNASNLYQYQYLTVNSVSRYQPKSRQFQSVYSYDYVAPTLTTSVQIPLALDFDNSRITLDPSAIMPIMAVVSPENVPLPEQMTAHTVDFGLPETLTDQIPSAVIYDAAIAAVQASMGEIAPEYFSAIDISHDRFAQQVGATRAVKVYFGAQQNGEMVGRMLKYMSQSFQAHIDANPDQYPDGTRLKALIDKIQLYNKGYQSADVGALLQLIEAIAPISFNQVNYYYLDNTDRLLAKEQRLNVGGDFMGTQMTMMNQVRYDSNHFNQHALTPLLTQSFGANAAPAMDGNAWIKAQRLQKSRLEDARSVRYNYIDTSYDYDNDNYDYNSDDEEVERFDDVSIED